MSEELQCWVALVVTILIFIWLIIALYLKDNDVEVNITVNIIEPEKSEKPSQTENE